VVIYGDNSTMEVDVVLVSAGEDGSSSFIGE
jgi:hypothetical protein